MAPPLVTALSGVKTVQDCANYDLVVKQHIPQLQSFFPKLLEAVTSGSLKQFYISTNPFITAFAFSLSLAPIFLLVSEINKNYSQVDRCWSLLPALYAFHYAVWAHLAGEPTQRVDLIAFTTACWSARLTFNYWRRGGYQIGSEDYRWNIIKDYIKPALFFILNVTFISSGQSVLLMLVQSSTYVLLNAARIEGDTLKISDYFFAGLILTEVVVSAIADQQQWNYQTAKYHYKDTGEVTGGWTKAELNRGFRTRGLWAYSRHPNFAAEQSVWITLYQWNCWQTYTFYNWAGIGTLAYLLIFQGSTPLTERITAKKYPEYKEYQKRVSMFVPKPSTFFTGPLPSNEKSKNENSKPRTD